MNTTDRFDGSKAWENLPADVQAAIGATTLELICAWHAQETGLSNDNEPLVRAADHADMVLIKQLQDLFVDAIPRAEIETGDQARLPAIIGAICRECGCSQDDGCQVGCYWIEPDLCSACKPGEASQ